MEKVIKELDSILTDFSRKLNAIPDFEFNAKPLPKKWSKQEVMGHLIDSAHNNLRRFITAQYETHPKIVYDQDFWVRASAYQGSSKEEIIQLWVLMNRRIQAVLKSMPKENLVRTCDTGKQEISLKTIDWLAQDYVKHMKHHLNQVIAGSFDVVYP